MARTKYRKEFFDREYTVREVYPRLWKYVRKYKFRLSIGVICGMLSAGALLPFYQVMQPAMAKVENTAAETAVISNKTQINPSSSNKIEKKIAAAAKLPPWFSKAESYASRFGLRFTKEDGTMDGAMLLLLMGIVPAVVFVRLLMSFLNGYCLSWASTKAVADLRCDMMEHVQGQSLEFFGRIDMGQIMSRVVGDPGSLGKIMTVMLPEFVIAPFEIFVSVYFILKFAADNGMMGLLLILLVGVPFFLVPVLVLGRKIRKWMKVSLERGSVIGSRVHEVLTGVRIVKAYHTEERENIAFRVVNDSVLKSAMRSLRLGLMLGPTVETVGLIMIGAFVVWCYASATPLSNIVPMVAPLLIMYRPIKQLSKLQVQVQTSLASLSRIFSLLDVHMELPEKSCAVEKRSFDDAVKFEHVYFKYGSAPNDAVNDADFSIPRGKTVAVVGSTGSGKSTMGGLLARFYDPRQGRITIDGIDLRDLKISSVHKLVGAVLQETVLFNDTIETNISYGMKGVSHEDVVRAAKLANAHDFIMAQPEGYKRKVGEKGFALSGGERQRIAIARAILLNPPILILDEATSALDTVTEHLVQEALEKLMKNRTIFAIAHRLSTVRNADLILVMDHGRIVERGTHDELYAVGGMYRQLCDMQLK
jgi:subfamily B ATP-binding cassette protein MsbA